MLQALRELNGCIIIGSFKNQSKEKSWVKFHTTVQSIKLPPLDDQVCIFLCMSVFQAALNRLWPVVNEVGGALETKVGNEDNDIISYIGGSVLRKLREKVRDGEYGRCLQHMQCTPEEAVQATLTQTKDRGGLTFLGEKTFIFFKKAEAEFRARNDEKPVDRHTFMSGSYEALKEDFCKIFSDSSFPDSVLEQVLRDVMVTFHKIRIHHRGRVLMQKLEQTRKKSLRRSLKK